MAIYTGDQPTTSVVMVGGQVVSVPAATLKASYTPAGFVAYTFTDNFGMHSKGGGYRKGASYPLSAVEVTALQAAGAPMVAA